MAKIFIVAPDAPMEETEQLKADRTLGSGGIRLGVLDNSKGNADHLLNLIVEGVKKEFKVDSVVYQAQARVEPPGDGSAARRARERGRPRRERDGRLRVVHVVECPRHGAADQARPDRRGGVLGFVHEARHARRRKCSAFPICRSCKIQHPLGGLDDGQGARARGHRIAAAPQDGEGETVMSSLASDAAKRPGAMLEVDDDPEAVYEFLCAKGWSDGLPVIPPTPERVERMLAYCDRDFDQPVVKIPPRFGAATPIRVAANAVMAGCKPEYFPLVLLALEALAEEPYNLYGTQATTHPCTPMLIFNGPIAKEVGTQRRPQRHGQLLPRQRGDRPRGAARARQHRRGDPRHRRHGDRRARRRSSPSAWRRTKPPARGSRCTSSSGFPRTRRTVTVIAAEGPHNINDHESLTAEGILTMIGGHDDDHRLQQCLLRGPAVRRVRPRARADRGGRRHEQGRREAVAVRARDAADGAASRRRASSAASAASSPSSTRTRRWTRRCACSRSRRT